jgi:excisionase family DNA binding protein
MTELRIALSPREVATATSLSLRSVMRAIASNALRSRRVGRRRLVLVRDVTAFLRRSA